MNRIPFTLTAIASFAFLAGCGAEPAPEPVETEAAVEPEAPSIHPPDEAFFASLMAETCPNAEPVSTSICKRAGMGSPNVVCEFGLGDDEYLRNETTLVQGETAWELADPESTCAIGA